MDSNGIPTLKIFRSAIKREEDFEVLDLSEQPPCPSTPPLILREEVYDVQFITLNQYLEATDRWVDSQFHQYVLRSQQRRRK